MITLEKAFPVRIEQQRTFVAQGGGVSASTTIKRPSWKDMIANYPNASVDIITLYSKIGNGLLNMLKQNRAWENTCAFRMSKGLNYSGFKLPHDNSKYKKTKGGVHIGGDKLNYWYRVRELAPYLSDHLGKPEIDIKLDKIEKPNNLKKKNNLTTAEWTQLWNSKNKVSQAEWAKIYATKEIITFDVSGWTGASGHFTLWDGNHLIYPGGAEHDDPKSSKYYFHMLYPTKNKNNELGFVQTNRIRIWELK